MREKKREKNHGGFESTHSEPQAIPSSQIPKKLFIISISHTTHSLSNHGKIASFIGIFAYIYSLIRNYNDNWMGVSITVWGSYKIGWVVKGEGRE